MAIPVIVSVETRAMQTGTIPERSWQATCTRNKKGSLRRETGKLDLGWVVPNGQFSVSVFFRSSTSSTSVASSEQSELRRTCVVRTQRTSDFIVCILEKVFQEHALPWFPHLRLRPWPPLVDDLHQRHRRDHSAQDEVAQGQIHDQDVVHLFVEKIHDGDL